MPDLKFGDVVSWETPEGFMVRWMILADDPKYHTQYRAMWVGDDYPGLRHPGDINTIGTNESNEVIRREI